jgi:hypothetical protein
MTMASYTKLETHNATDWVLIRPQGIFEALRLAWMIWRHPDKAAVLTGIPPGWLDAHTLPVCAMRDVGGFIFRK